MTEKDKTESGEPKEVPPKKDPSHTPKIWDPFQDGFSRGKPGADADFDIGMNRPPWEKTPNNTES